MSAFLRDLAAQGRAILDRQLAAEAASRVYWAAPHFNCSCPDCEHARYMASISPWSLAPDVIENLPPAE